MLINIFDTAIESDNLGDQIIMESVWDVMQELFAGATFIRTPSHKRATLAQMRAGRQAELSIVGGTNILKSHMLVRGNWRITPLDYLMWRNVVLMGVGWQQYGGEADAPTRLFFDRVLSEVALQSVRDMHTYEKLHKHVPNTIYTGCPTMWKLDDNHCDQLPTDKARDVVFAVTYYRDAPVADRRLFELLKRHYRTVYFWPQQALDIPYARKAGIHDVVPIEPNLAAYDHLLDTGDVDFVGARLHGGIRALQRGRRALIIPVDNRAAEISKTTNLPIIPRELLSDIESWIAGSRPMRLTLPRNDIARWKAQFLSYQDGRCRIER